MNQRLKDQLINKLNTRTVDMKGRQSKNGAPATEPDDFVTLSQITGFKADGTKTDSIVIPPVIAPTSNPVTIVGAVGTERTSIVSGVSVSATVLPASDGSTTELVVASFSLPIDGSWSGVQLRVYNNSSQLIGTANGGITGTIILDLPNPSSATTWTWKLVSFDTNGRFNTEQTTTPHGTLSVGSATGTMNGAKILAGSVTAVAAIFATAAIQSADINSLTVSKLTAGTITTAVLTISNVGGSGIVTDITQIFDGSQSAGLYTGISIRTSATLAGSNRCGIGPFEIGFLNTSNQQLVQLGFSVGGLLNLMRPSGGIDYTTVNLTAGNSTPLGEFTLYDTAGLGVWLKGSNSAGFVGISLGGTIRYAPGCDGSGKRFVFGSAGTFNGGTPAQVTIATGLTTVESFVSQVVNNSGTAESCKTTAASGGSITVQSSLAASTSAINWMATGT